MLLCTSGRYFSRSLNDKTHAFCMEIGNLLPITSAGYTPGSFIFAYLVTRRLISTAYGLYIVG